MELSDQCTRCSSNPLLIRFYRQERGNSLRGYDEEESNDEEYNSQYDSSTEIAPDLEQGDTVEKNVLYVETQNHLGRTKISSRVGRNQATVMRICDRWMQEGTTYKRGRSHPPQCTTSCEDRQIVHMAVMDRSVISRTVAQHIESVTHHSLSARTIRRRLQQSGLSARCQLLDLPLTQNHRRLRHQWCDERRMWVAERNEVVFTDGSRICLQHHDGRIRVWRHCGERMLNSYDMHWSCTSYYGMGRY
ncbi:transposable element Tcb1 transposase [Trichonephila clavipes]|nr:transposable element Tcb1 transposase [Trichonephila clavipes]